MQVKRKASESMKEYIINKLVKKFNAYPDIKINSSKYCIPHILNISVMGIKTEKLYP